MTRIRTIAINGTRPRWVLSSDGTLIDSAGRAYRIEETIDRPTRLVRLPDPPPPDATPKPQRRGRVSLKPRR